MCRNARVCESITVCGNAIVCGSVIVCVGAAEHERSGIILQKRCQPVGMIIVLVVQLCSSSCSV